MSGMRRIFVAVVICLAACTEGYAQEIVDTILSNRLPIAAVCSNDCRHVYVADQKSESVIVVDTTSRSEVGSVRVGGVPMDLIYDSKRNRVYVLSRGDRGVSVVDLTMMKERMRFPLPRGAKGASLAGTATKVYVGYYHDVGRFRGFVDVVDLDQDVVAKTLSYSNVSYNALGCPISSTISADGLLYLTVQCVGAFGRLGHDPIWIYDTRTDLPVGAIYFGDRPHVGSSIMARPGTREIWAGGGNPCSAGGDHGYDGVGCDGTRRDPLTVIDAAKKNEVRQRFLAASQILGFTPDGKLAFINASTSLMIVDAVQFGVQSVPLPVAGGRVAVDQDGRRAFVPIRSNESGAMKGGVAIVRLRR